MMKKLTVALAVCVAGGAMADVVIDNASFRLTVGDDAVARSLVVKATGEECLDADEPTALFAVTQDRPFNNEIKLIEPNKRTTWPADRLRREGDRLIVGFPHHLYEAVVRLRSGAGYVVFELEDFRCDWQSSYRLRMDVPPVASFRILQLSVKNRRNFGNWLNASWDDRAAVGVVGIAPMTDIDHDGRRGSRILYGELFSGRRLRGGAAALVAAPGREPFLDAMSALEDDFDLPKGVKSRRGPAIAEPIFHLSWDASPKTIDALVGYAKKGGFRLMTFDQCNVTEEIGSWGRYGDYDLKTNWYPNGTNDLVALLARVKAAGIHPGFHVLHTHIGLKSRYVTPVADPRLNKTRRFTLAAPLPEGTNDVAELRVFEPTADVPMYEACRILQFGGELLSYERYSAEPPYRFFGVKRGAHSTRPTSHPRGEIGGILDVSEFGRPMSCYLDQNTDLQDEIADKLAAFYACGFEYVYLDGAEGVNRPFNYHVANGQYRLWRKLMPEPLSGEGAAKTHFGWHMLAGGNAFDVFKPDVFKAKLREFPFAQAPKTAQDMTRVDFGWWQFYAPSKTDPHVGSGTQADMWEYGASVAAAWNCASSCLMSLDALRAHPRTDDILETMRRWGDVRRRGLLREDWRNELKDVRHEHHLLLLADGTYDLVRWERLAVGDGKSSVRAFLFEKDGATWVAYWHETGSGRLLLDLPADKVELRREFAEAALPIAEKGGKLSLPADARRYLKVSLPAERVRSAFRVL